MAKKGAPSNYYNLFASSQSGSPPSSPTNSNLHLGGFSCNEILREALDSDDPLLSPYHNVSTPIDIDNSVLKSTELFDPDRFTKHKMEGNQMDTTNQSVSDMSRQNFTQNKPTEKRTRSSTFSSNESEHEHLRPTGDPPNLVSHDRRLTNIYPHNHEGPYIVHVEGIDGSIITNLNHKTQSEIFLPFLNIDGQDEDIYAVTGKNRYTFQFTCPSKANNFVSKFKSVCIPNYKAIAFIPSTAVEIVGIIRGVDPDITDEELSHNIICRSRSITNVRRFKSLDKTTNTHKNLTTVAVHFKGNSLPTDGVRICHRYYSVELYIPRVTQCFNCLRFRHVAKYCRSKVRCQYCGNNHKSTDCDQTTNLHCANCDGAHCGNSTECQHYIEEKQRVTNEAHYGPHQKMDLKQRRGYTPKPLSFPPIPNPSSHVTFLSDSSSDKDSSIRHSQTSKSQTSAKTYSTALSKPKRHRISPSTTQRQRPSSHSSTTSPRSTRRTSTINSIPETQESQTNSIALNKDTINEIAAQTSHMVYNYQLKQMKEKKGEFYDAINNCINSELITTIQDSFAKLSEQIQRSLPELISNSIKSMQNGGSSKS